MRTGELEYELPPEAVAQQPLEPRHDARLLVAGGDGGGPIRHRRVCDLPSLLRDGDVVVLNDTRVAPARLQLRKPTGGKVEVLVTTPVPEATAEALVRPSRRVPPQTALSDESGRRVLMVGPAHPDGRRQVTALAHPSIAAMLEELGEVPLPPYIRRRVPAARYQTIYAQRPTSAAAPTAGLHLSETVLAGLAAAGIAVASLDLGISVATFRPITAERLEDHVMHSERYTIPPSTWEACQRARRVVAVGTTVVRALETAAASGDLTGASDLFIRPPYRFAVSDVLLTNFHMPRSSLLCLLAAFVGERWRRLYESALKSGYRFGSFGDAMLVRRCG
ncbi:MAG: tRNA preQ1(34) S-adenosylmethionine ribosyltransferase-isomerase QueA [Acidimicrobiia bacterium]|nr:tRNA preQ1(34) S-adenosylmethionine ribosyltransferase-isomerase QueA [Acidimicrobiia bacterium]MYB23860.1 tRNA preQ1(34) S-adenosylmethionine ribosyltransferase-isomerase QueA [Acidimicrobiia bacterium]MYE68254.1 tRNA preQ1(34) S-adenosylmethionine ribosyltransferase-isomerase QueA [Acidimicrobiia bacterium]MYJ13779.1 tRNA preQ1(34) S-adenosylmethionine ribosyltransferase-isomerase QueA [Acidimicrobiia bacterium]